MGALIGYALALVFILFVVSMLVLCMRKGQRQDRELVWQEYENEAQDWHDARS